MRTFDHWLTNKQPSDAIGLDDYHAIGTMDGALQAHADIAYRQLKSPEDTNRCQRIFRLLTRRDSQGRARRAPMTLQNLSDAIGDTPENLLPVINHFRSNDISFIMPPLEHPLDDNDFIDISHESLMRVWPKLAEWMESEAHSASLFRRLVEQVNLFPEDDESHLSNPALILFENWKSKEQPNAAWAERYGDGFAQAMQFLKKAAPLLMRPKNKKNRLVSDAFAGSF